MRRLAKYARLAAVYAVILLIAHVHAPEYLTAGFDHACNHLAARLGP